MHKFLIKDGQGFERDFGSSTRAAKLASQSIGKTSVCATQGRDVLWMLPEHADYFRSIAGDFKVVNTSANLLADDEAMRITNRIPAAAERVRHVKLGEGSVISRNRGEGKVVVQFDRQKKPLVMAENFLVTI